jgi:hypothetical protein
MEADLYNRLMTHLIYGNVTGLLLAEEIKNAFGASKLKRDATEAS